MNEDLVARVLNLYATKFGRVILGITGAPGAGKTTMATNLRTELEKTGISAVNVPMDGFHLADEALQRLHRLDRKGAIDTFDAAGYVALLKRIRAGEPDVIYAPNFERTLEQPIAGSIAIMPDTQVVITEGNYLTSPMSPWNQIPDLVDEIWHCRVDPELRHERLIERHIAFGKDPEAARRWVLTVDEVNATQVESWSHRADLIILLPM